MTPLGSDKERKKSGKSMKMVGAPWSYSWSIGGLEYIKVSDEKVAETKQLREGLLLDLDKQGNAIGIEIMSGPPKKLKNK